ncbi:hypothetical protein SPRG_00166 [Saprolegnia parasitica CBS 223.65]|uniref:Uncharacterized protein n=1 Tax=Saprolegnia parasitica (strain CBS 223.65) TaxID=695850 RepID=A0A067D8I8_SAPPC|nr:hypothetical protein SPRG_00166 [Saprolegnia parasitica CBS 223.65]KDO35317.1 hypothetical protein SPRG_00166 [Saprolegnia parasitica CBS 223.65]|eukprot:XP_012193663.1 hypothetical protein SPRG_00166 [Saprolegnia parasitica CBS 223.65]
MDLPRLRLDFTDAPLSPDDPRRRIVEVPKKPTSEKAQSIRDESSRRPATLAIPCAGSRSRRRTRSKTSSSVAYFELKEDLRYWVAATDRPKNVHSIMNAFYKLWLELFRHDDAALGLRGRDVLLEELTTYGNEIRVHGNHTYHFFKPTK